MMECYPSVYRAGARKAPARPPNGDATGALVKRLPRTMLLRWGGEQDAMEVP
jgi:hypothetical protein